jgi:hypothetical protein
MSDHGPDPGLDELDERASAWLDGEGTTPDDAVRARAATFDQARAGLAAVPAPPPGALDGLVAAALLAYDEERAAPTAPTDAPATAASRLRSRRALRWLAPLGAAAAVATVLGVAGLADRGGDAGDVASEAPASQEDTAQLESAPEDARAGAAADEAARDAATLAAPSAGQPAPTTTAAAPGASGFAAPATDLGAHPDLAALAAARSEDGAVSAGEADAPPPTAPATPAPPFDCAVGGVVLGTAELAGRTVTVVERPDATLAAFDADCTLVDETTP